MSKFSFHVFLSIFFIVPFSSAFTFFGPEISLMNIDKVWDQGITGRNVTVAVIDDGVNYKHIDLESNYAKTISYDFVGDDMSPLPEGDRAHGTKCAGLIAAQFLGDCRTGVAYDANLAGIRLFNGNSADENRTAYGFGYKTDKIDIYSNSWGPSDNGYTVKSLSLPEKRALSYGASRGRGGRGSIYVFATGNGGFFGDSCAFDGYVNDINTVAIGPFSRNGGVPRYAERCSSVMAAAYGDYVKTCSGTSSECVTDFGRTSAAAAFASGIIALLIEANNGLTQRDIQHLIVRTSNPRRANINEGQWSVNGAGLIFHPVVGFGVMDARKLVDVAKRQWTTVPRLTKCSTELNNLPKRILRKGSYFTFLFDGNYNCSKIKAIEHLKVELSLQYTPRGIMEMYVISPDGTKSQLLYERKFDSVASTSTYKGLVITSLQFWGENPAGEWTVFFKTAYSLSSHGRPFGELLEFKVSLYGTEEDPLSYNKELPTGTITCGAKNRIWRGYGLHCCGSLWTYDPNHEMCCSQSHEIVPRASRCGSTTYNKCEKVCCGGELSDKFQNSVAMSCCGRNTYDKKKQTCCDGKTYEKFACKEYQLWEGYYQHEVKCSEGGNIRYVVTEEQCKAPCKDEKSGCRSWWHCVFYSSSYKKKNCAKTCDVC